MARRALVALRPGGDLVLVTYSLDYWLQMARAFVAVVLTGLLDPAKSPQRNR
jgi:hypothetical protein